MQTTQAKPFKEWNDTERLLAGLLHNTCIAMKCAGVASLHVEGPTIVVQMHNGNVYGPINIIQP